MSVLTAPDAAADSDAVVARGVVVRFGDVVALDHLDLTVRKGEFLALAGPDGAGKSTLIRTLCSLVRPDAGTVVVLGEPVPRRFEVLKHRVGYLAQRFSQYPDLTVDENIDFFARIYRQSGWKAWKEDLLAFTGLAPFRGRLADHLSGGMKQKLALACTLVHRPELLLLDEPTAGVDPSSRREFFEILSGLLGRGLTIVMATPYLDEAERCNRTALMSGGRMLAIGSPRELKAAWGAPLHEAVCRPVRETLRLLRDADDVADVHAFGERVHFTVRGGATPESVVRRLAESGIEVLADRPVVPSLEDVFIGLTAAGPR